MTINDAVLYVILIWPIGLVFLYYLFGKWLGPEKEEEKRKYKEKLMNYLILFSNRLVLNDL